MGRCSSVSRLLPVSKLALAAALVGSACAQDPQVVTPPTFDRPSRVAFFCYDSDARRLLALSECVNLPEESPRGLTALVSQSARGEIATVDLRTNVVLDADVRVPGFTFVRVGEVPTAIVVPPEDPSMTYIASFGSRRVQWEPTNRFRPDLEEAAGLEPGAVALPDGPVDLIASPDEQHLYAALPQRGTVIRLDMGMNRSLQQPSAADEFALQLPDPLPPLPEPGVATTYRYMCIDGELGSDEDQLQVPVLPMPPAMDEFDLTVAARPVDLEFVVHSDGTSEILVADAALPVIHRLPVAADGTLSAAPPIQTGAPVRALAVTPPVPVDATDPNSPSERYLYAIDATDGSVMALDVTDPNEGSFGTLLPVAVGTERADRLDLLGKALSLAIMTPGFPGPQCEPAAEGDAFRASSLRGVFLGVALANGFVQAIDIHDLTVSCRGAGNCDPASFASEVDREGEVYLERHRPRFATFINEAVTVGGQVTFLLRENRSNLEGTGRPTTGDGPGLAPLASADENATCPLLMRGIFPASAPDEAVICAVRDPWAAREERWTATWAGSIPFSGGGLGRVDRVEGAHTVLAATDARFCEHGTLGRGDVAALPANALERGHETSSYGGDRLVITTDPPPAADGNVSENCRSLVADAEGLREQELGFLIDRAFQTEVHVRTDDATAELARLSECWNGALFGYEIRVGQAFAVVGSRTGFLHRVVQDEATGACRVDFDGQPVVEDDIGTFRHGRAFDKLQYINPYVSFTPDVDPTVEEPRVHTLDVEAVLQFTVANVPNQLGADIGDRGGSNRISTIVESIVYSDSDQNLYAVDSNSDALVRVGTSPFLRSRTFE